MAMAPSTWPWGTDSQPIRIYRNDGMVGGVPLLTLVWSSTRDRYDLQRGLGDYDGDGSLDLAVGNYDGPVRIYHNDGIVGRSTPHDPGLVIGRN